MDFSKLKKQTNRADAINQLVEQAAKLNSNKYADDRIFKIVTDQAGNAFIRGRFLPSPDLESTPWNSFYDYGFKKNGKWYIEKSLTTIGKADPVAEFNSALWATGDEDKQNQARQQKRRQNFVTNFYVIDDKNNPDNNGKVFIFKFGQQLFKIIQDAMAPEFPDQEPVNPWDIFGGADFKLKAYVKSNGFRSYDKSGFETTTSALLGGDEAKLTKVMEQAYDLSEFTDPNTFKSYNDLKQKLYYVLGIENVEDDSSNTLDDHIKPQEAPAQPEAESNVVQDEAPEPKAPEAKAEVGVEVPPAELNENGAHKGLDDDPKDLFKKLATEE